MMPSAMHPSDAPALPLPLDHTRWVDATRRTAVAALLALIALCLAWELVLAPLRPGGSWLALAELLLCLILFAACAAHVRLRLRYAPSAATAPS